MKSLLLLIIIQIFKQIHGQCSGGIWPIQDSTIGSFTVSWRYNIALNTVQFIIQGQANSSINLTSTYIAIGWSDTASATNKMDIAMFFPGTRIVQDGYSQGHIIPSIDDQQDFSIIQTNITGQNIYVTFERYSTTGDIYDISFTSNVYVIFSMGIYKSSNDTNNIFQKSLEKNVNLINCNSSDCLTKNCSITSCSCLQEITTNIGQCVCFPPSLSSLTTISSSISAIINGSCQNQTKPCSLNGICLQTSSTQFICQCKPDYTGVFCQTSLFSLNDNIPNTCQCMNGGLCLDNGTCSCPNEYIGTQCDIINSCLSNPCQNNGSCSISSNNYLCQCISPYGGINCDLITDVCTPNPCLNNGNCIRNLNILTGIYRCECPNGYSGTRCEFLSACISSPCQNGGECISTINNCSLTTCSASCICPNGTSGIYCEKTECTNSTCSNNGVCFVNSSSGNSTTHCLCSEDYTGQYCQISLFSINPCLQKPCGDNNICIQTSNSSYYCICSNGLTGQSCNSSILGSCSSSACRHLSTCQQIENANPPSYKCICPNYLIGDRCQYTNNCQKQPCLNQGSCIPLGPQNNFMCICSSGFGHYDCSIYLGLSCNSNVCLNGGICDSNSTNIRCICPEDFAGPRCEWRSVCSVNTCQNDGTCRQIAPTMAECLCQTGFTGPTCNLRDSCETLPCKNGGGCTTLLADTGTNWSAYRCVCPSGIYGQNCDTIINSCSNMLCPAYKICSEQSTGPVCTCSGNKVGTFCQYDNPCSVSSTNCQNNGTCISSNTDPPFSSCLCQEGFTGKYCEILIENDPCASNPCQTRGYCALLSSNKTYTCVCQENFIGEQCERSNPCLSSPCLNQGICQANLNQTDTWFNCRCVGTYTGNRCETSMLNPCGGLCMNGSPCNNGVCVCPAQYTGTFCGFDNPCYDQICQNGGICSVISNTTNVSFTCTCPSSYTGQYCEIPLNTQIDGNCSTECMNAGSCVNGICMCTSQYVGPSCQYENPCNNQNPCLNSGTCFGRYNTNGTLSTQCFCLQGFTGNYCEATLCSPTSCNGGICRATQNNIVCVCSTGKFGDRCQYEDACATNPCLSTERCEQIGNQYQCISCYDKSSYCSIYQLRNEYCDNRYTILVDDNFLPVPQACQRSCGQCIPVQRFKDISLLFTNSTLIEEDNRMLSTTIITDIQQTKCIDKRDDCSMQKAYGFCGIFNEKYPDDCVKTCHPDCAAFS